MTDLIKTVSLLQELIISRVLDKLEQGSDEAFIQLRNELIKINNLKPYLPTLVKILDL